MEEDKNKNTLGKSMLAKADITMPIHRPVKHEARIIPKEEIMANRCSKYEFLNFEDNKEEKDVK